MPNVRPTQLDRDKVFFTKKPIFNIQSKVYFEFIFYTIFLLIYILCAYFYCENHLSIFKLEKKQLESAVMTADGLITTSTFAFIAFTSGSPSSSGSSTALNRLYWKSIGLKKSNIPFGKRILFLITLRPFLFITIITTVINTFALFWFSEFVVIGTMISVLILVLVIIRYVVFIANTHEIAANILSEQLSFSQWKIIKHRIAIRNFFNLLRGTRNRDFLRSIINTRFIKVLLKMRFEPSIFGQDKSISNSKITTSKLLEIILWNNQFSFSIKMNLLATCLRKTSFPIEDEDKWDLFYSGVIETMLKNHIEKKVYKGFLKTTPLRDKEINMDSRGWRKLIKYVMDTQTAETQ